MLARLIGYLTLLAAISLTIACGCSGSAVNGGNPVIPNCDATLRHGMEFLNGTQTIFGGGDETASDVDHATVVWGEVSAGETELGTIVVFEGDDPCSSWVTAVGIEDPVSGSNYPVIRFLKNDGETMSDTFPVPVSNPIMGRECRLPRVDCTYLGNGMLDVVVAYRYADTGYNWDSIEDNWDIRVTLMRFRYNLDDDWEHLSSQDLEDPAMQAAGSGQTHPDIAINQYNGDIYCAWTYMHSEWGVRLLYKRYNGTNWTGVAYMLESRLRDHDPYFVSLDVGLVYGIPGVIGTQRIVGFAYTGQFFKYWNDPPDRDDL